jgi:hypothetical protein
MAGGPKLSRKQTEAIAALLASATHEKAAEQVGINDATLRRWMAQPAFQAAYDAARAQVLDGTITLLLRLNSLATVTLHRNLSCGKPGVEVRAALGILEMSLRALDYGRLAADLQQLRNEVEGLRNGRGDDAARGRPAAAAPFCNGAAPDGGTYDPGSDPPGPGGDFRAGGPAG